MGTRRRHCRRLAGNGRKGRGPPPPPPRPPRLLSEPCTPAPRLWGRCEAQLSILSSPREALGHVPRPDKDRLSARCAARNLAISAPRAAAPALPGDARSLSCGAGGGRGGKAEPLLPPPPSALRAGVFAGPRGSPPSPRPWPSFSAFPPEGPRLPAGPGPPARRPRRRHPRPHHARPRCLLKVTRRSRGVRGAPALAAACAACAAALPSVRRAVPRRPGPAAGCCHRNPRS